MSPYLRHIADAKYHLLASPLQLIPHLSLPESSPIS
jgi:hypothetical protein